MLKKLLNNYINNFKGFPREVWILTLVTFINRAGTMVIPFLSKYLKDDLQFSYSQIGWIMSFFGLGSLLGTWLSGLLSDKIGYYKVMVFSLCTTGLAFFLMQQITTFEGICVVILFSTTLADLFRPAMLVSLKSYAKKGQSTRAFTLVRSGINLGFLFGPGLGGLVIVTLGYKYLFYIDGITCILGSLIFIFLVKEKKSPLRQKKFNLKIANYSVFKDIPFLLHMLITVIGGILYFQTFVILPMYHKVQFHLSEFSSGLFLSMSGLFVLFFELPIVSYVEKHKLNNLKVVAVGLALQIISLFILINNAWSGILYFMIAFMTLGAMLIFPFSSSFAMSRVREHQEGKYMAIFTMSYSIAHIISAKMSLEIIHEYGYNSNWIILCGLGSAGLLLGYWLNRIVKNENSSKLSIE